MNAPITPITAPELDDDRRQRDEICDERPKEATKSAGSMARREGFEPPTLRFEAGFAQFQKAPETKDFGQLAHIA